MGMVDFGLVGTGHIAHEHAKALQKVKGARLVAVYSKDAQRADVFSKKYKAVAYSNLQKMLEHPGLEAVDIVNRNGEHAESALVCVLAGKHVVVEKPFDVSVAKARKVLEEARKKNVRVSVISQYRFGGALQKVKKKIEEGEFGKLILGQVFLGKARKQSYYDESGGWKKDKKLSGGGVLMFNAVHYIDVLRWLFGEVKEVSAMTSTLTHTINVEDIGGVLMKFQSGALGMIAATTSLAFNIPDRIEIYGEKCGMVVEGGRIVRMYRGGRVSSLMRSCMHRCVPRGVGSIQQQLQNVVDVLQGRGKLVVSGEDGLRVLEILEKVYR